jgi:hypothetical protein
MLLADLENPSHVELQEPTLELEGRVKCWLGRCDLQELNLQATTVRVVVVLESLDQALSVPVADHLASDHFELVGTEILCPRGGQC